MDESKTQQLLIAYARQKGGWQNMPLPQDWVQITHGNAVIYINYSGCTILDIHPFKYLALGNDKEKKLVKTTIAQQYDPKKRNQSYISCWATCPFPEPGWLKLYHIIKNQIIYYHAKDNKLTAKHPCRTSKQKRHTTQSSTHYSSPSQSQSHSKKSNNNNNNNNNNNKQKQGQVNHATISFMSPPKKLKVKSLNIQINSDDINNNKNASFKRHRATTTPQDKKTEQNRTKPSLFNLMTKNHHKHKSTKSATTYDLNKKQQKKLYKKKMMKLKSRRNAIDNKQSAKIKDHLSPKTDIKGLFNYDDINYNLSNNDSNNNIDDEKSKYDLIDDNDEEDIVLELSAPSLSTTMDKFIEQDLQKTKYGKSQSKSPKKHKKNARPRSKTAKKASNGSSTPQPRSSKSKLNIKTEEIGFDIIPFDITTNPKSTKLKSSKSSYKTLKNNKLSTNNKRLKENGKKMMSRRTKSSFEGVTNNDNYNNSSSSSKKSKSFKHRKGIKIEKSSRKIKSNKEQTKSYKMFNNKQKQKQRQKLKQKQKQKQKSKQNGRPRGNHIRGRSKTNQFFEDSGTSQSPIPIDKSKQIKFDKKRTNSGDSLRKKRDNEQFKRFQPQKVTSLKNRKSKSHQVTRNTDKHKNKNKEKNTKTTTPSISSMSKSHHKRVNNVNTKRSSTKSRNNNNNSPKSPKKKRKYRQPSKSPEIRSKRSDHDNMPLGIPQMSRQSFSSGNLSEDQHRKFSLEQKDKRKKNKPLSPTPKTKQLIKRNNRKSIKNSERERKKVKFEIKSPNRNNLLPQKKYI